MRFGEKCKEKTTKMTEDSPRVTDLINNANFLLNVSILCHFLTQINGNYQIDSINDSINDDNIQSINRPKLDLKNYLHQKMDGSVESLGSDSMPFNISWTPFLENQLLIKWPQALVRNNLFNL